MALVGCDPGASERIDTIYRLKSDPSSANVEKIRTFLDDEDPQVRVTAMYQLVELKVPDAAALALESLTDTEPFVRKMAAQQLGSFHGDDVARGLAERTGGDEDDRVRRQAAVALASVGGEIARQALSACLTDPMADVRKACVEGIARLGSGGDVETLVRLLSEDPEWEVRVQAARALGLSGDRTAIPALEAATEDVHEYVRGAAAHALERVRSAPERPEPIATEPTPADS